MENKKEDRSDLSFSIPRQADVEPLRSIVLEKRRVSDQSIRALNNNNENEKEHQNNDDDKLFDNNKGTHYTVKHVAHHRQVRGSKQQQQPKTRRRIAKPSLLPNTNIDDFLKHQITGSISEPQEYTITAATSTVPKNPTFQQRSTSPQKKRATRQNKTQTRKTKRIVIKPSLLPNTNIDDDLKRELADVFDHNTNNTNNASNDDSTFHQQQEQLTDNIPRATSVFNKKKQSIIPNNNNKTASIISSQNKTTRRKLQPSLLPNTDIDHYLMEQLTDIAEHHDNVATVPEHEEQQQVQSSSIVVRKQQQQVPQNKTTKEKIQLSLLPNTNIDDYLMEQLTDIAEHHDTVPEPAFQEHTLHSSSIVVQQQVPPIKTTRSRTVQPSLLPNTNIDDSLKQELEFISKQHDATTVSSVQRPRSRSPRQFSRNHRKESSVVRTQFIINPQIQRRANNEGRNASSLSPPPRRPMSSLPPRLQSKLRGRSLSPPRRPMSCLPPTLQSKLAASRGSGRTQRVLTATGSLSPPRTRPLSSPPAPQFVAHDGQIQRKLGGERSSSPTPQLRVSQIQRRAEATAESKRSASSLSPPRLLSRPIISSPPPPLPQFVANNDRIQRKLEESLSRPMPSPPQFVADNDRMKRKLAAGRDSSSFHPPQFVKGDIVNRKLQNKISRDGGGSVKSRRGSAASTTGRPQSAKNPPAMMPDNNAVTPDFERVTSSPLVAHIRKDFKARRKEEMMMSGSLSSSDHRHSLSGPMADIQLPGARRSKTGIQTKQDRKAKRRSQHGNTNSDNNNENERIAVQPIYQFPPSATKNPLDDVIFEDSGRSSNPPDLADDDRSQSPPPQLRESMAAMSFHDQMPLSSMVDDPIDYAKKKQLFVLANLSVLVLIAIFITALGVGLGLGLRRKENNNIDEVDIAPSMTPSFAPSEICTLASNLPNIFQSCACFQSIPDDSSSLSSSNQQIIATTQEALEMIIQDLYEPLQIAPVLTGCHPNNIAFRWLTNDIIETNNSNIQSWTNRYLLASLFASWTNAGAIEWTRSSGWISSASECTWFGVQCGTDDPLIIQLLLADNNLSQGLPLEFYLLHDLRDVDLTGNALETTIASEIGLLSNLDIFAAENCRLFGTLPDSLFSLTSLLVLNLNFNPFGGNLPTLIGRLQQLQYLLLRGTVQSDMQGSVPTEIGLLTNLVNLAFSEHTFVSGRLPTEIGNLSKLTFLSFEQNRMSIRLTPHIASLSSLELLFLGGNNWVGSLPTEIGSLQNLALLRIHAANAGLTLLGTIPTELGNLTNLVHFTAAAQGFTGTIPSQFGFLTSLSELDLRDTKLTGSLPSSFGNLSNLRTLNFRNVNFQGELPSGQNISSPECFDLSGTSLEGTIPSGWCKTVETLIVPCPLLNQNCTCCLCDNELEQQCTLDFTA